MIKAKSSKAVYELGARLGKIRQRETPPYRTHRPD